ncbi:MAG: nucleotide sugar dehydrogenase, partial [Alphaproteobacteria bacterium]|nr:nucleotide sugar dehydrogenase [Alphaproteobacteria bacterium]
QNGRVDLSYIYAAVKQIAPHLQNGCVVVTKSTIPVGTTRQIYTRVRDVNPPAQIAVASNPEFLREGQAIGDFMNPDRVVIGAGYVGLVSAACFAKFGHDVICIDNNPEKLLKLESGIMPIYEPGLETLVEKNQRAGKLTFTTDLNSAVAGANIVIIAVGTPEGEDGMPDMSQVAAVATAIAPALSGYTVVMIKSTVPIGTNRTVSELIAKLNPKAEFDVAFNPEFLREGAAIEDFMSPDRIVAGISSPRAKETIAELYEPICLNGAQILFTTFESAEMIKYTANSLLAARIAFINEVADLCEKVGANVRDVAKGVGLDHRIGDKFLRPGPGYGGSCFPKDTIAFREMARRAGAPISIIEATVESNAARKLRMVEKVIKAAGGSVAGKTIATLGLTFKPGTDDMREAASLVILPELMKAGATIRAFDPQGMKEAAKVISGDIAWCESAYSAMEGADLALVLTEWNEFRSLDMSKAKSLLKIPLMVDLRNVYKRKDMLRHGFHYVSVGRQDVKAGQTEIADMPLGGKAA